MDPHPVTAAEVAAATDTIAQAFRGDPVWSVALGVAETPEVDTRPFWRIYVEGALRFDTVYAGEGAGTVSVWIPPGESELSEEQEAEAGHLVEQLLPPDKAGAMLELWERFGRARPVDRPHAYLSLLATRPDRAGHGYGMAHLAADLTRWDDAGVPTYLESTNPRNDARYARHGYAAIGRFEAVLDQSVVTLMWRPVGG
ncbi:GNAT family N-acetyltransferase [Nocardioides cynanchi]|uniref:GNAT family N-acetyltransferase n=1 Tax=Nocardioides cynanchi TaxID=2558918 RepID=UPI0012441957|nr:GNAT family N-acetyltransferase [Nocardioides cynanchi]